MKQRKAAGKVFRFFAAVLLFAPASAVSMPVYQTDDRKDLWEVEDPRIRALADSTVAIIASWKLFPGHDRIRIRTTSFAEERGLCAGEPFADQRAAADCSGVLVAPDLVLTTAHCIPDPIVCKTHSFVFGFGITKKGGRTPAGVPASEVYDCSELVDARYRGENMTDWAVVRLDRPVRDHRPLELDRKPVALNTPVVVIGHPNGLPAKAAGNARVVEDAASEFFRADLDSFGGNSGSPVFNAATGGIVGVLSRGETDFETIRMSDGTVCAKTRICFPGECDGEDVTRVSEFGHLIPDVRW